MKRDLEVIGGRGRKAGAGNDKSLEIGACELELLRDRIRLDVERQDEISRGAKINRTEGGGTIASDQIECGIVGKCRRRHAVEVKLEPGHPGRNGGDVSFEPFACDHNRLSAGTNGIERMRPPTTSPAM